MKKAVFITVLVISLLMNILTLYMILAKNPMNVQGDKSWVDLYSSDAGATVKFLNENLGIKVVSEYNYNGMDYRIIKAKDGIFPYAGVMQICDKLKKQGLTPHATIYLTVKNYEEIHKKFIEQGAKPILEKTKVKDMIFGIYIIPGGLDVGIIQYLR